MPAAQSQAARQLSSKRYSEPRLLQGNRGFLRFAQAILMRRNHDQPMPRKARRFRHVSGPLPSDLSELNRMPELREICHGLPLCV